MRIKSSLQYISIKIIKNHNQIHSDAKDIKTKEISTGSLSNAIPVMPYLYGLLTDIY